MSVTPTPVGTPKNQELKLPEAPQNVVVQNTVTQSASKSLTKTACYAVAGAGVGFGATFAVSKVMNKDVSPVVQAALTGLGLVRRSVRGEEIKILFLKNGVHLFQKDTGLL